MSSDCKKLYHCNLTHLLKCFPNAISTAVQRWVLRVAAVGIVVPDAAIGFACIGCSSQFDSICADWVICIARRCALRESHWRSARLVVDLARVGAKIAGVIIAIVTFL